MTNRRIPPPAAVLGLILATGPGLVAAAQDTRPASPPTTAPGREAYLPQARAIVNRAIAAFGGKDALDQVRTIRYTVTIDMGGISQAMHLHTARSRRLLCTAQTPQGETSFGRVGDVAWSRASGRGYSLMSKEEAKGIDGIDIYGFVLDIEARAVDFRTVGRTTFDDADCYKVQTSEVEDATSFAYFDAGDGRLRGIEKVEQTPTGEAIPSTMIFSDYQAVKSLTLFTTAAVSGGAGPAMTLVFSEVEYNTVPETDFEIPAEVRALASAAGRDSPTTRPAAPAEPSIVSDPTYRRMLERLETMNEPGILQMWATVIEGQISSSAEEEQPGMRYVVEKIRARIRTLQEGGGGG